MRGIESSRVMVLIFSQHANRSRPVRCEIERALNKNLTVVPFRIEDAVPTEALELFLSGTHWLDAFSPPLQRHIDTLADRIVGIVGHDLIVEQSVSPALPLETQLQLSDKDRAKPNNRVPLAPADPKQNPGRRVVTSQSPESESEIYQTLRGMTRKSALRFAAFATCVLLAVTGLVRHFVLRDKGEDFFEIIARQQGATKTISTPPRLPSPEVPPLKLVQQPVVSGPEVATPEMSLSKAVQPPALTVPDRFLTIEAALAAAKPGDTVRIRSGAYKERIRLPDGVSLAAEESRSVTISIDGKVGSVLDADGCKTGSTIKGIVFSHEGTDAPDANAPPVVNVMASKLIFDDCVFEKGVGTGIRTTSATVSFTQCEALRNGAHGFLLNRSDATLRDCLTENNLNDGLRAYGAGCVVKAEKTASKRNGDTGLVAENGACITATQSDSVENSENGVAVLGADSEALWQGGVIQGNGVSFRGGIAGVSERGGQGVVVEKDGARFSATETLVAGNWKAGVVMKYPKSNSSLTLCRVEKNQGVGVIIYGAASTVLRMEDCQITDNHAEGLVIAGTNFRPVIVRALMSRNFPDGLAVFELAEPQLDDCKFDGPGQNPINRTEAGPGMTVK